jgi:hypothetical protein
LEDTLASWVSSKKSLFHVVCHSAPYLHTLDEAAWGAASEMMPKFISKSDPTVQWTGAHKGHAFFAYANNYLIDLKAAIIIDVEATRTIRRTEVVGHVQ